jgi:hypothetical protein
MRWILWPVTIYLSYFDWRWAYYGLPIPTTYYAKTLVSTSDIYRGGNYAWDALRDLGLLAVLPFAALAVGRMPSRDATFLGTLSLFHAAYVIDVGGDWMPFWRFWIPIAPFVFTLFIWGLQEAWYATRPYSAGPIFQALIAAFLCLTCAFVAIRLDAHSVDSPQERAKLDTAERVKRHTRDNLLAAWPLLRWVLRRPGEWLVTDYGGVFSVFTDANIVEMWGLCNAQIALRGNADGINPIYGKTCVPCYKNFRPDYFHVMVPLVRGLDSFKTHDDVIAEVFQGRAIDRYLDLRHRYVTGRVVERATGKALY